MSNLLGINSFFLAKMAKIELSYDSNAFDLLVKKGRELSDFGIDSNKKAYSYRLIKTAAKALSIELSRDTVLRAISAGASSHNDACLILLQDYARNRGIIKVAYPNHSNRGYYTQDEVDINKWLKTVHLIYNAVQKNEMTKDNALEYYSNYMNKESEEDIRFKRWFKYYSEGEHLKYSSDKEQDMKKKAVYMSNLGQSAGTYTHGGGSAYVSSGGGNNMPGDSFDGITFDEAAEASKKGSKKGLSKEDAFGAWKSKLHAAIRRIDKLLRNKLMDDDKYMILAEHLLHLSHQVHVLKLASTMSDVTYKTAGALERHGERDVADMLVKVAQEIPEETLEGAPQPQPSGGPAPEAIQTEEGPGEAPPEAPAQEPSPDPNDPKSGIPSADDVEPVDVKNIEPIPGARPGEYEELAGNVDLDDAANKLDEVAGMLADRRIIRQLAEFDIMLDKIGIASMFPELAESQSKLIDAFSYALTRVTKMMGQLANAKSISETRTGLPGRADAEPVPEEPSAEEPSGLDPEV